MNQHTHMFAMNLQLLAEGTEGQEPKQPDNQTGTEEQIEIPEEYQELFSKRLAEEMANKQAEVDKAFAKMKKKQQEQIEQATQEAARLAQLSEDERKAEEFKQKVAELERREAELNKRSMQTEIKNQLALSGMPDTFLDVVYSDDAEKAKANIESLKAQFEAEVNARVQAEVEKKFSTQSGPSVSTKPTKTQGGGIRFRKI